MLATTSWWRSILTAAPGFRADENASAFYQANENKAENLAAATARHFLGLKLECAQCHDDRSGGNWTREQFWELAAFFSDRRAGTASAAAAWKLPFPTPKRRSRPASPTGLGPPAP